MSDFIWFRKIISFFVSSHINIFKIGLEIQKKLPVERTMLQICESQTKSDQVEMLSLPKKINGFLRKQKY